MFNSQRFIEKMKTRRVDEAYAKSDNDSLHSAWDKFLALAKKAIPNIKSMSAKKHLDSMEAAWDDFSDLAIEATTYDEAFKALDEKTVSLVNPTDYAKFYSAWHAFEQAFNNLEVSPKATAEMQKGFKVMTKDMTDRMADVKELVHMFAEQEEVATEAVAGLPLGKRYPLAKRDLSPEDVTKLDALFKQRDAAGVRNGSPEYNKLQAQIDTILGEAHEDVEQEIYGLSSGTIASLTGFKKQNQIELFQVALANYAHKNKSKDWKEAFRSWMGELGVTMDTRGNADPQELKAAIGHAVGESAVSQMVDTAISMLADHGDSVDKVMDLLMSKHNDLEQSEWEEVEAELQAYVDDLEEAITGDALLKVVDDILANKTAKEVDGTLLDLQTASVISQVAKALSPENKAKFLAGGVVRAAKVAWSLVK